MWADPDAYWKGRDVIDLNESEAEEKLMRLRRKAAAWDRLVARALATIDSADRDGAYLRCELASVATAVGDDELSPYAVHRERRERDQGGCDGQA